MEQWLLLIFVGVVLAVLVLLLYLMFRVFLAAWWRNQQLARYGVETDAEVIERKQKQAVDGTPLYYITYRYQARTAEGIKDFTFTEQLWFTEYDHYPEGTKVWVRYLPSNPQVVLRSQKIVGRG
jgi:hypothetical protein